MAMSPVQYLTVATELGGNASRLPVSLERFRKLSSSRKKPISSKHKSDFTETRPENQSLIDRFGFIRDFFGGVERCLFAKSIKSFR
jgi:hypothetical protein